MGWHVFVVDADSYPVHRDKLFCGVKNPRKESRRRNRGTGAMTPTLNTALYGLYADLKALRVGDIVFFYQMRKEEEKHDRGFRGIFKVKSEPFFDDSNIDGVAGSTVGLGSDGKKVLGKCPNCNSSLSDKSDDDGALVCQNCGQRVDFHILPNRVLIEPVSFFLNKTSHLEAVIDDNTAYIDRNYIKDNLPVLWTMLFRKTYGAGRERSITHILPDEARKLEYMFNDLFDKGRLGHIVPYMKPSTATPIVIPLDCDAEGELKIEALLEAWMMENIDKNVPVLRDIIGNPTELEYFGNNVLYGIGGERVDILCIHKHGSERTRATVIELKKGDLKKVDVEQINDYTKWMSQLVFGNDTKASKLKIQPVLIGFSINQKIVQYAKNMITDTQKPILLKYDIDAGTVKFTRVL